MTADGTVHRKVPSTAAADGGYAETAATTYLSAAAHLRAPMLPASAMQRIPVGTAGIGSMLDSATGNGKPLPVGRAYARRVLRSGPLMERTPGINAQAIAWHCRAARRQVWVRDVVSALAAVFSGLVVIVAVGLLTFRLAPRKARGQATIVAIAAVLVLVAVARAGPALLLLPVAGAAVCCVAFLADNLLARHRLRRLRTRRNVPGPSPDGDVQVIEPREDPGCEVVPYAMDRIVGAGVSQGASTIRIAVDKPAEDVDPSPFSASDLLRHIADNAQAQAHPHPLTHGIPQLDVALVLGVPEPQWIESRRPVPTSVVYERADNPQSGAAKRAYIRARAVTWDGQIVVSLYVSVVLEGKYLSVIVRPHVLPPVVDDLRIVDGLGSRHFLVHVSHATVDASRELRQLGVRLAQWPGSDKKNRRKRKEHRRKELISPREAYAEFEPDHITQEDDMLRIIGTIRTRVFDVTEQFLKDKGIDTDDFASQVQYIVQNSVIVHGPASNVQNVHGDGAQAANQQGPRKGASS
jgi:hypothetical protein